MKKILLVKSGGDQIATMIATGLPVGYAVHLEKNIEKATTYYSENRDDVVLVIVSSFAFEWIPKLRESYEGPIIAASGAPQFNDELVSVGCTHRVDNPGDMLRVVADALQLG